MTARRILFLTANPEETTRLSLQEEMRDIQDAIQSGRFGNRIEVRWAPAIQLARLQEVLDAHEPQIVHFAGHGSESLEELIFLDAQDEALPADVELLASILAKLEGVVLNACCSARQAEAVALKGPWAIGTSRQIKSSEARAFARTLYAKLANGHDVEDSFAGAAVQLGLIGRHGAETIPQLFAGTRNTNLTSYPLLNALVQLWARCRREDVPVRAFHKLMLVNRIAPRYFQAVFDTLAPGVAVTLLTWLRQQAQKHALEGHGEPGVDLPADATFQAARRMSRDTGRDEVDVRMYLVALLSDRTSETIRQVREQANELGTDGFKRIVHAAESIAPEPYEARSKVSALRLGRAK